MRLHIAVLILSAIWVFSLPGQDFRATITGQVIDVSGAAIPGAKVRIVQRNTGAARRDLAITHEK